MMGGNHRVWYPPFSRQERFIHVCRQREQRKALEEEACWKTLERVIDSAKLPRAQAGSGAQALLSMKAA